jgi:4-aminobutyrate--pyruvate transaminase
MFPAEAGIMTKNEDNAKKHGLILRFVGNRIAFSPPLIISQAEVGEMIRRITLALDNTWSAVRAN